MCLTDNSNVKWFEIIVDPPVSFKEVSMVYNSEAEEFGITPNTHDYVAFQILHHNINEYQEKRIVDVFQKHFTIVSLCEVTGAEKIFLNDYNQAEIKFQMWGTGSIPLSCYAESESKECLDWTKHKLKEINWYSKL